MAEVGSLNIDLILKSARFLEGINKSKQGLSELERATNRLSRAMDKTGKDIGKIGSKLTTNLTLPIVAAGVAIGAAVTKMATYGSSINDMSVRTGFSRESLQELGFAAKQTGVEMGSIELASRKLTKSMGEAATGSGETANLFKQLGVEIKNADGSLRPANEVFMDTIGALNRIPDETTRNVVGMKLLGKSFGDITPLVSEGKEGLKRYAKEARDAGLVMSEEGVIAADNFGDKMDKLRGQLEHAGMEVATAFLPIIEQLANFVRDKVVPAIKSFAEWWKELSPTTQKVIVGIAGFLALAGPLTSMFGGILRFIPLIITGIQGIGTAFTFMTGPIGLTIAAVGLLVIALSSLGPPDITLEQSFETQKSVVESLTQRLGLLDAAIKKEEESGKSSAQSLTNQTIKREELAKTLEDEKKRLDELSKSVDNNKRQSQGQIPVMEQIKNAAGDLNFTFDETAKKVEKITQNLDFSLAGMSITDLRLALDDELQPALFDLDDAFKKINNTSEIFGLSTMEVTRQKIAEVKSQMQELISNGVKPTDERFIELQNTLNNLSGTKILSLVEAQQKLNEVIQTGKESLLAGFAEGVGETIGELLSGATDIGEALKKLFIGIFKNFRQIGASLIATGTPMLFSGVAPVVAQGTRMVISGAGIVAAATAAQGIISSFAAGGLVFGETLSLVGEGAGTSRSNPEVIAPLDKLMGFMQPQETDTDNRLVTEISGENLRLVLERTNKARRFTGR